VTQYAVKNSCPEVTWNLYGFPMPSVSFKFEGKDLEIDGEKFTVNYTRNGIVKLQINGLLPLMLAHTSAMVPTTTAT
jgi:hypothetical protein